MKRTVILLIAVSFSIYGIQLLVFRDPQTTWFYFLQDMAFMPITIAIATLIVGEVMNEREKKERMQKTRMLTSSFFTELGASLLTKLKKISMSSADIQEDLFTLRVEDETSVKLLQEKFRLADYKVFLTEETLNEIRTIILEKRTTLIVIASNPLLLDHEEFTEMLWAVFHLIDEFRLRGEYASMSQEDIAHLEVDLARLYKLLLISWTANVLYIKTTYPNFYTAALNRMGED